jgi:two-component system phosphate regulon response regulator PhoB
MLTTPLRLRLSYASDRRGVFSKTGTRGIYHKMTLTILHVEDHETVADAVRDALRAEGWRVLTCGNGPTALRTLTSSERYDLLITDNDVPGVCGLDIVRHARRLPHRAGLPIVMLSASDCRADALRAGVDAFLPKPEGISELIPTVARLLGRGARLRAL